MIVPIQASGRQASQRRPAPVPSTIAAIDRGERDRRAEVGEHLHREAVRTERSSACQRPFATSSAAAPSASSALWAARERGAARRAPCSTASATSMPQAKYGRNDGGEWPATGPQPAR